MKKLLLLLFISCGFLVNAQSVLPPDTNGMQLRKFYLSLNVEKLWLSGHHVNWVTGQPDSPNATAEIKTHCSAFAAAATFKLGIYMLRPPQHAQELLSNAQYAWLASKAGIDSGWIKINNDVKAFTVAQRLANQGFVVTAVYGSADPQKPGHIALVMPEAVADTTLSNSGPKIIMAGQVNYNITSLQWGFRYHVTQWPENVILFYYNRKKLFNN